VASRRVTRWGEAAMRIIPIVGKLGAMLVGLSNLHVVNLNNARASVPHR